MKKKQDFPLFKGINPELFLAAAKRMVRAHIFSEEAAYHHGCCMALAFAAEDVNPYLIKSSPYYEYAFESVFNPGLNLSGYYMADGLERKHFIERRILALLLCYEICKEVNIK